MKTRQYSLSLRVLSWSTRTWWAWSKAINRLDGSPFDEDDQFLLTNICETRQQPFAQASLLQAERKLEILQTLVQVSAEITSTLNLDRVLQAVVGHTQAIIPFERAAIALEQRGMLQLKAISGMTQINPGDPAVSGLKEMLEWASISTEKPTSPSTAIRLTTRATKPRPNLLPISQPRECGPFMLFRSSTIRGVWACFLSRAAIPISSPWLIWKLLRCWPVKPP
jgi:hypothetical protein